MRVQTADVPSAETAFNPDATMISSPALPAVTRPLYPNELARALAQSGPIKVPPTGDLPAIGAETSEDLDFESDPEPELVVTAVLPATQVMASVDPELDEDTDDPIETLTSDAELEAEWLAFPRLERWSALYEVDPATRLWVNIIAAEFIVCLCAAITLVSL